MTRIGLLSDVHASPEPLREALAIFREKRVDTILCAGDIAGYGNRLTETVALLQGSACHAIIGNHDLWHLERTEDQLCGLTDKFLRGLPLTFDLDHDGVSLLMVHASPPDSLLNGIRLLDEAGGVIDASRRFWMESLADTPCDVLVVGHTHQVFAERLGGILVINPGSTLFNHTCAILSLPDQAVEFCPLPGKTPIWSWNFSMLKDPP